jgi:hypothetical protein
MFQPNPTTVTVMPPARSIQVVGEGEPLVADEELITSEPGKQFSSAGPMPPVATQQPLVATNVIPQVLPQPSMVQMTQPQMTQPQMAQPQMGGGGPFYMGPNYSPYPPQYFQHAGYPGINMGSGPAVYAQQQGLNQQAQVFTSGVPGAPPTIAINTDGQSMSQFMSPMNGIRPQRSNITLKRSKQPFGSEQPNSNDSNIRVTVTKGN